MHWSSSSLRVPCIHIHTTPGRLDVQILLGKCLLWSHHIGWEKKRPLKSRLRGSRRSNSFGALWQVRHCKAFHGPQQVGSTRPTTHTPTLPCTHTDTGTHIHVQYMCLHERKQSNIKHAHTTVHGNSKVKRYKQQSQCTAERHNRQNKLRHTKTPSAMTKEASADLTHDLKPWRLPLFQPFKTVTSTAPPLFTKWLQSPMIANAKTPINPPTVSSSTSSFLPSDPGPLGSTQRHGCSSVNQRRRTERGPYWLLFSPSEWHYWNPNPGCVHVCRQ